MRLKGQKIVIFVADKYEDMELHVPLYRLLEEGAEVVVAGEKKDEVYKGKNGCSCKSNAAFDEINAGIFAGVVIPGGYAPDKLRTNRKVLEIVQHFNRDQKMIAFICHAGWVPASAGVLKGIRCTSYISIKDDVVNAGGKWEDAPLVQDRHFISSRTPADLPHFCPAIVNFLAQVVAK